MDNLSLNFIHLSFETGSIIGLEVNNQTGLAGQLSPGTPSSLSQYRAHKMDQGSWLLFTGVLRMVLEPVLVSRALYPLNHLLHPLSG